MRLGKFWSILQKYPFLFGVVCDLRGFGEKSDLDKAGFLTYLNIRFDWIAVRPFREDILKEKSGGVNSDFFSKTKEKKSWTIHWHPPNARHFSESTKVQDDECVGDVLRGLCERFDKSSIDAISLLHSQYTTPYPDYLSEGMYVLAGGEGLMTVSVYLIHS